MSRIGIPHISAFHNITFNKFLFRVAITVTPAVIAQPIALSPALPSPKTKHSGGKDSSAESDDSRHSFAKHLHELFHRHSLGAFAVLGLLIAVTGIQVGAAYWSARISAPVVVSSNLHKHTTPLRGPNMVVSADQLNATVEHITAQPLNLIVGEKTVAVDPGDIKNWLQIVTDKRKNVSYIHLNEAAIAPVINKITDRFVKAPVNQVTVTYPDGTSAVIATGKNGSNVGNPTDLAKQIAPSVLGAKGMQLNVPLQTVPFQAVTPAAFDKMIEVNIVTKQMYMYEKGQVTQTYAVSAGAPETPTPIGQYKIYSKLTVQDMKGFNPNGTPYLQPHVHWINYFLPGGYAVHGNYWRPLSWFGAINSSHGCVSLPDNEAKIVYDWAPIGTTVITHT